MTPLEHAREAYELKLRLDALLRLMCSSKKPVAARYIEAAAVARKLWRHLNTARAALDSDRPL